MNLKSIFSISFAIFLLFSLISFADSKININLKSGWNLISVPSEISVSDVKTAGCEINGDLYYYANKKWNSFKDGKLEIGKGYWINVKSDCSVSVNQGVCKELTLKKGWNLIGVANDITISGINCIEGDAYYYENGKWITTKNLKVGKVYWISASQDSCKITCESLQEVTLSFTKFDYSVSGGKIEGCLLDSNCKKAMAVIDCDEDKKLLWTMGVSSNKIKFGVASCSDDSPAELEVGTKDSPKEYDCNDANLKASTASGSVCKKMQILEDSGKIFVKLTKPDSCSKWSAVAV